MESLELMVNLTHRDANMLVLIEHKEVILKTRE